MALADKKEQAFAAHICDLLEIARKSYTARFSGFLDARQLVLARGCVSAAGSGAEHLFFGGYPGAERVMLGAFAPYEQPDETSFPIVPLTIGYGAQDAPGHRDLLGSLTGLAIGREAIGDILVGGEYAVCFVSSAVAPVILNELKKAGRCGVRVCEGMPEVLPALHRYADLPLIVTSLRLDCMVAAVAGLSREKAAQAIRSQLVAVNGAVLAQTSGMLCEGDVFSIRGYGKYLFKQVLSSTKKGRLHILCRKYV